MVGSVGQEGRKGFFEGLIKKLEYQEPLEMLSCFACILGDSALDKFSLECLAISKVESRATGRQPGMDRDAGFAW